MSEYEPLIGARTFGGGRIQKVYGSAGGIVLCDIEWQDGTRKHGGIRRDWINRVAGPLEDWLRAAGISPEPSA